MIRHPNVASRPPRDSWEEHLNLSVGPELWEQLTDSDNKCNIYLYKNVARWNDSAAKEAFDDAKTRFLAKIKNVPCNLPLPDPDAYIDEIDWSDSSNPEMILEEEESWYWRSEGESVIEGFEVILGPSFCIGWGPDEWYEPKKEEEVVKKDAGEEKAWGAYYWEANLAGAVGEGRGNSGAKKRYNSSPRRCTPKMAVVIGEGRVKCTGR